MLKSLFLSRLIARKMNFILESSPTNEYTSIIVNIEYILKHMHIVLLVAAKPAVQPKTFCPAQSTSHSRVVLKKSPQNGPRIGFCMTLAPSVRIPASKSYPKISRAGSFKCRAANVL